MRRHIFTLIAFCSLSCTYAQTINWNSLTENQKHITYLNFGYDYGVTTQVGYAQQIKWFKPLVLNADFASPMGTNFADDLKLRIGGQLPVYSRNNLYLTLKLQSVYRKHETNYVSMSSFGSEIAAIVGIYKPKWHLAGELGYDNATITHLKHNGFIKEVYPEIQDGWYQNTGGNFFFGFQASRKIGNQLDINLRAGATNARSTDEDALLPIYFKIGLIYLL